MDAAASFWATHRAPGHDGAPQPFPFPSALFHAFIDDPATSGGHFPVTIQALPPGSVVRPHVPCMQIAAHGRYAPLATWLETLLTHVWYPSAVATLARRVRDSVEAAFEASVDEGRHSPLLSSRLHDFGFRGVTCVEQAVTGGVAHLLSWGGTDTAPAAWFAQHALNGGLPVAFSIPATEHAVMTAWATEGEAVRAVVAKHGGGAFACVLDSYDYQAALDTILPSIAATVRSAGGFCVIRPDSGDPLDAVLAGLRAAEKAFGADTNAKGFRVPRGAGVIQGDGMSAASIARVLGGVLGAGYAASAVAFGMGGGLLQKVDRDVLAVATKLSRIGTVVRGGGSEGEGVARTDVMKAPATDAGKCSLPGRLAVARRPVRPGSPVDPADPATFYLEACGEGEAGAGGDALEVVYSCGPLPARARATDNSPGAFHRLRDRIDAAWKATPVGGDAVCAALRARAVEVRKQGGRAPTGR